MDDLSIPGFKSFKLQRSFKNLQYFNAGNDKDLSCRLLYTAVSLIVLRFVTFSG